MHAARAGAVKVDDKKPAPPKFGYVYFIRCEKTKLVKIGFSEAFPTSRLRQLQTGSGGKLRLIAFIRAYAKRERELHAQFASHRERGEWFRLEGSFAEWLRELDA